ncbi:MAG: putative metal-binding motif-containing protein, partial [Deltaproteobacteria bacterium]|nr:putative metal-binding motif-containing protein [Deltaproteobacteria bacterium]
MPEIVQLQRLQWPSLGRAVRLAATLAVVGLWPHCNQNLRPTAGDASDLAVNDTDPGDAAAASDAPRVAADLAPRAGGEAAQSTELPHETAPAPADATAAVDDATAVEAEAQDAVEVALADVEAADGNAGVEAAAQDAAEAGAEAADLADATVADDSADGAAAIDVDGADASTATDLGPVDTVGACVAQPELCDGADNDCDGQTDEGFAWQPPWPSPSVEVGESCAMVFCPDGVVVCASLKSATCSTCPATIDDSVILAPPGSPKVPLVATGSFTDISSLLPLSSLQVDQGSPLTVPFGASGLPIDADGDGDLDVWWSDGVSLGVLWVQVAPWEFKAAPLATLVGKPSSVAAAPGPLGPTLLLAGGGLVALERQPAGEWKNVAAAVGLAYGINDAPLLHLLPADVNDDGTIDLVGSVFSCTPGKKALAVWLSRGAGGYIESAASLGLQVSASAWATLQTDYDDDGLQDLLVLTESCNPDPGVIFFRHQAIDGLGPTYAMKKSGPLFTAPGKPTGSPMGGAHADLNGDGVLDYLFSEIELGDFAKKGGDPKTLKATDPWLYGAVSNHLLLSQPDGSRKQAGFQAGVWAPLAKSGSLMVAWTPILTDLDHDGHIDILLSHGDDFGAWATADVGKMRPVAWRNDGTQQFVDASALWGLPAEHESRAMALGDLDGDGDDDLVLGGQAVPPRILRNDLAHKGADLRVELQGNTSNPWGLGARLHLKTNLRTIVHEHGVQAPSQTMQTPISHFALKPGEAALSLAVTWPSGWAHTVATP